MTYLGLRLSRPIYTLNNVESIYNSIYAFRIHIKFCFTFVHPISIHKNIHVYWQNTIHICIRPSSYYCMALSVCLSVRPSVTFFLVNATPPTVLNRFRHKLAQNEDHDV
jgi:hypothetical protein